MAETYELLGYRDLHYSEKHRRYGALYMYDVDGIEYNSQGDPLLMVELKHGNVQEINLDSWQFVCLRKTADRLNVPLICVVYYFSDRDKRLVNGDQPLEEVVHSQYYVIPVNDKAKRTLLPNGPEMMNEARYVRLLYWLRKAEMTDAILRTLDCDYRTYALPEVTGG